MKSEQELKGLGGWLILVGLGLLLSPVRLSIEMISMYQGFISEGAWGLLTTPTSPVYHSSWALHNVGEAIVNVAIVFFSVYLIYLFFLKKMIFPRYYCGFLLFIVIFLFIDALLIQIMLPDEPLFDEERGRDFFRSVLACLIWIPYMRVSKRVKLTFVEK